MIDHIRRLATWGRTNRRSLARGALVAAPFLVIAATASALASAVTLRAVLTPLLATSLSVAIFAVNFAFLSFQLSPYRTAVPGLPWRLVAAAGVTLLLSLIPLWGLALGATTAATLGLVIVPVLVLGALGVVLLGQYEGSASGVLRQADKAARLSSYVSRFEQAARSEQTLRDEVDDVLRAGPVKVSPPMHEIFHEPLPPVVANDPLEMIVTLGRAAIGRDDTVAFTLVVEKIISLTERLDGFDFGDDGGVHGYLVKSALLAQADSALSRVSVGLAERPETSVLAERFVTLCASYVRASVARGRATHGVTTAVGQRGVAVCGQLVAAGRRGNAFIEVLSVLRQACELTLRDLTDPHEEARISIFANQAEFLADAAIESRDSEALYRCSETLSWMGCSAVRCAGIETGQRVASALVQLGRRARKEGMDCFWEHCSRTPYDHAVQHLDWLVSWIPRSGDRREHWLDLLGTAESRLRGTETTIEVGEGADRPKVKIVASVNAHVESVSDHGVLRSYDYSDPAMVDELSIH